MKNDISIVGQERSVPAVIDLEVPASQGIRIAWVFLASVSAVIVVLPLRYVPDACKSPGLIIGTEIAGTMLTILAALGPQRTTRQMKRTLHELARQNRIEACAAYLAELLAEARETGLIRSTLEIPIANRHYGACLRIRRTCSLLPDPSPPIDLSFPPVLLDEVDIGFIRFAEGIRGTANHTGTFNSESREEWLLVRRVRRSLAVNAIGWGMRDFIRVLLFLNGLNSFQTFRIDWRLVIWLAILLMAVFASPTGILGKRHWFIFPGGLYLRTPSRIPTRSSLEIFDRRESVLCPTELRLGSWTINIANARKIESTQVTVQEADMLL